MAAPAQVRPEPGPVGSPVDSAVLRGDGPDRHAANAALHGNGVVHPMRMGNGSTAWLLTGYDVVRAVLTDLRLEGRTASVGHGRRIRPDIDAALNNHMLHRVPPDHGRMRATIAGALNRRRMEAMRPRIQELTDALFDALEPDRDGVVDLMSAVALPLPLQVLTELFGVPAADTAEFHEWTTLLTAVGLPLAQVEAAADEFLRYVRGLLERKRVTPVDDLLSVLAAAHHDGGQLSADELTSMVFVLLTAGYETTVNLIGNGARALLADPARAAALRADPAGMPAFVEEVLRTDSPVQVSLRTALVDVEYGGAVIPAGATVLVSLLAANRDPRRFAEPDRLCPGRTDRHLGFGHGLHYCVGAPLARIEAAVALEGLLTRFPGMHPAEPVDELAWRASAVMHGLARLPVRPGPARKPGDAPGPAALGR